MRLKEVTYHSGNSTMAYGVSLKGRRFLVKNALVWNVVDLNGTRVGQAASFSHWTFLSDR